MRELWMERSQETGQYRRVPEVRINRGVSMRSLTLSITIALFPLAVLTLIAKLFGLL